MRQKSYTRCEPDVTTDRKLHWVRCTDENEKNGPPGSDVEENLRPVDERDLEVARAHVSSYLDQSELIIDN